MTQTKQKTKEQIQSELRKHIASCLKLLGYDLRDPNIRGTPTRMVRVWMDELYTDQPATKKLFAVFPAKNDQMITLVGHETWSRCPHHFERVRLRVSIAYIPDGRVLGVSKLARIADYFAKGLVLQETFVERVVDGLMEALEPKGVAVHVKGEHLCMQARGVETDGHVVTTALRGVFMERPSTQEEFLREVHHASRAR